LGLTGIQILSTYLQPIPLNMTMIKAVPQDLNVLPEYGDDDRTLDKLIDGVYVTQSDEHMWLIPFNEGDDHLLIVDLGKVHEVLGIRVWNYNKSVADTQRGAKAVQISLDGKLISDNEFIMRKGPGVCHYDFAQDILFSRPKQKVRSKQTEELRKSKVHFKKLARVPDYEPTVMPSGFVFKLQLISSWGDPYYLGLNGIEFYNDCGELINLSPNNITAYPHSVNVLEGVENDIRTPDKLIDGFNDTSDGRHMWLAPIFPGLINLIYVVFDEPVTVSMVKLWNYSKTSSRGVRTFGILVDDLLVYHGELPQVTVSKGILPTVDMPVEHHTVLFTDEEGLAITERKHVLSSTMGEQDVQLTNDKRVLVPYSDPKNNSKHADPALRPKTSVKAGPMKRRGNEFRF